MRKRLKDKHRFGKTLRTWRKFYKSGGGCRWSHKDEDSLNRAERECREACLRDA